VIGDDLPLAVDSREPVGFVVGVGLGFEEGAVFGEVFRFAVVALIGVCGDSGAAVPRRSCNVTERTPRF
jgi:hypothetical protein